MNDLEEWLPRPGESEPDRKYHRVGADVDGIEARVKFYYMPCSHCIRRAQGGEPYDRSLMILCNGVGHLMVAANRPLCEEPPR